MEELKPCPFCGKTESVDIETAKEIEGISDEGADLEFAAVCNFQKGGCGVSSGYSLTKEGAVEKWNLRAAPENAPEVVKKLWALYDKYEDAEHAVCGDAAKLLQSSLKSKALTLEQLRQMDGEPVWVECDPNVNTPGGYIIGSTEWYIDGYDDAEDDYGKTWLAYARRPENTT